MDHTFNYFVTSCPILRFFIFLGFGNKFTLEKTKHGLANCSEKRFPAHHAFIAHTKEALKMLFPLHNSSSFNLMPNFGLTFELKSTVKAGS